MSKISDVGVSKKSERLQDQKIALCVCGGIASTEMVRVIRELRRHGARVMVFITPSVEKFISRLSLEWASATPVICEAGPRVEYLNAFDLVLVAPATLNTISKAALGLADNVVTLTIANQIAKKLPLLFVPAMNLQMRQHPLYPVYATQLQNWGAEFFELSPEEDKLKMPSEIELANKVAGVLGR